MIESINIECEPSPEICSSAGQSIVHGGTWLVDESGVPITDEAGNFIPVDPT